MLATIGVDSLDELINQTLPDRIRMPKALKTNSAMSEYEYLKELKETASLNKVFRSYIGLGYYDCITPSVILRNILENPGWYTQYTPYQSEISQGRLEALLNFQTMVSDLTAMPLANASLLDEGTAAAEAMIMCYNHKRKKNRKNPLKTFVVSDQCFPQTIAVLRTRAEALGLNLLVTDIQSLELNADVFGVLVQYPDVKGDVQDYAKLSEVVHANGSLLVVAADLLSLCVLRAPGEFGADVVVGTTQRFGVPLGYGGPHAAYYATKEEFLRLIPGRIIGVSVDAKGKPALRMTLQTREQHIKRARATSNICTAQALLATMAGMYAVYHGPTGLKAIARRVHTFAGVLAEGLRRLGLERVNAHFFDTLTVRLDSEERVAKLRKLAESLSINFYYGDNHTVSISLDECISEKELLTLLELFSEVMDQELVGFDIHALANSWTDAFPEGLKRESEYLTHPVFHSHHSETAMMRYIRMLENRDLSLCNAMIPLGSCTMKLNAATELIPVSWPEFNKIHPFAPRNQVDGYWKIVEELSQYLAEITGFSGVSLQPNSGAQGEYAGLMVIRAYHESRGEAHRTIVLVPSSAHGTNPASAVMAGQTVVVVKCDGMGNIDMNDLKAKAEKHSENLAGLMITYPSTHGVFEDEIKEACAIIHEHGGQIYMDGANMNAQVGLTNPGLIGADVCHLNLHKTFSIPHGGGGPGMGPICVAEHLVPFLPGHPLVEMGGSLGPVSAAPFGSASILLISYAYIKLLGAEGMTNATKYAILNANYLKSRLAEHFEILYQGTMGRVAHEFIIDLRKYKKMGIGVDDIVKRLIDYSFHAPTVSWPVAGTIMIEPTESEPKYELDRFYDALVSILGEIREVELGLIDAKDNVLKNAPHTIEVITSDDWSHGYSRQKAAFPVPSLYQNKFWSYVSRVNNTYGDRNVMCTCPPVDTYAEALG